ncbi:GtrA family protein [Rhodoblastus acidophilus]|uniref:GtrA family protein n=1 Tax=Candidatus Rhodoblastus alkanivorans TaxID=2954117 RepID=A0ABS9Z8D7_9HYPH|nr:GtrA family protein [Candidatus Rhodoblastus alkanivorans]MCI4678367.1 GtrA family protein [Candidatus Rhodoblastus alkanivorans]MCI4683625.1 GtrA family protein [Candidatus Rhodoblastus alkanivorans]MDI4640941.1 GtrA family protein [Rhodoblastus acidophilus]
MTRAGRYGAHIGRYLSVGVVCAVTHNAIMIGGDFLHASFALDFAISYLIVTPLGYSLHVRHTFKTSPNWHGLWRYAGANAAGAQISFILTVLFISGFGLSAAIAAPVVTILLFFWNFAATHWALRAMPPGVIQRARAAARRAGASFVANWLRAN